MLHRRGPEDLPSSQFLFGLLLAASLGARPRHYGMRAAVPAAGCRRRARHRAQCVVRLGVAANVQSRTPISPDDERPARHRRRLELVARARDSVLESPDPQQPPVTIPLLLGLCSIWSIDISAFVFSRALERPYLLCVAIVVGVRAAHASACKPRCFSRCADARPHPRRLRHVHGRHRGDREGGGARRLGRGSERLPADEHAARGVGH